MHRQLVGAPTTCGHIWSLRSGCTGHQRKTSVYYEATVWPVCGQIFIVDGNALSLFRLLLWLRFATIKISSVINLIGRHGESLDERGSKVLH